MKKRFWFGINKETNPCGFGCWQIAGNHSYDGKPNGWGDIKEPEAIDLLCNAIENGIDFFDTAQGYNNGRSEEILGRAISITGKKVVVATKISLNEEELFQKKIGIKFQERIEQSLINLKTSSVDILLIHNPPDDLEWGDFNLEILDELVQKKIIGTYGVSSRGLKGARNVIENNVGTTLEWVFNIFERRPIRDIFPTIEQKKMNFIARSPLSRGLINPKYLNTPPSFKNDDFRSTLPKDWVEWVMDTLRMYHGNGIEESELIKNALLFCLNHQQVNSIILGIKSPKQLEEYLKISSLMHSNFNSQLLNNLPEFYPKWG